MDSKFSEISMIAGQFGNYLNTSMSQSRAFLDKEPAIADKLSLFAHIANQTYFEAMPSDLDSMKKIGFFPFTEANDDIIFSLSTTLHGCYKSAYHHLRAALELWLIGIYFLSPHISIDKAKEWLHGDAETPFFKAIIDKIFKDENFINADRTFNYKQLIKEFYHKLCDIVHCKGVKCARSSLSLSNFPRFVEESLIALVDDIRDCLEIISIGFALRFPILLTGLPMLERFGTNPPLCGFLDQAEAIYFRSTIRPDILEFLDKVALEDEKTQSIIQHILAMPDVLLEETSK